MDWLFLTIICAFALASADAATKAKLSQSSVIELTLVRFSYSGILLAPLLYIHPFPDVPLAFWGWFSSLIPLEIIAMLIYMRAIRDYPLSATLPYLAFTPVFVILSGILILDEWVSPKGLFGILLVVAGAWFLNIEHKQGEGWRSWLEPMKAIFRNKGSRTMLFVAFIYSITSVLGKGAMVYIDPLSLGAFYYVAIGSVTLLIALLYQPKSIKIVWQKPAPAFGIAVLMSIMVITHFLALAEIQTAYMIAVKRTSMLFGLLYGSWLFHEAGLKTHLPAAIIMLSGVFLIVI